jgi:uncharacterized protein YecE (DUF72 family)
MARRPSVAFSQSIVMRGRPYIGRQNAEAGIVTRMISIACSGFPVPVSRYFQEFKAVEVSDTELGIPGVGTRRRWLREAPPGFVFTVLAPKQIAASAFVLDAGVKQAVDAVAGFAKLLKSQAVVFGAAESFAASKKARAQLRAFAEYATEHITSPVLDLPGWPRKELDAVLKSLAVQAAFDPLLEQPSELGALAYLRLPGPSGYRSRYDAAALDRVVAFCNEARSKNLFVAFRNIDRFENAKYVMTKLGIEA